MVSSLQNKDQGITEVTVVAVKLQNFEWLGL